MHPILVRCLSSNFWFMRLSSTMSTNILSRCEVPSRLTGDPESGGIAPLLAADIGNVVGLADTRSEEGFETVEGVRVPLEALSMRVVGI